MSDWVGHSFHYKLMTRHPEPCNILPGSLHSLHEYHRWSFPRPKRGRTFCWNATPWVFVESLSRLAFLFLEFAICNVKGQSEASSKSQKTPEFLLCNASGPGTTGHTFSYASWSHNSGWVSGLWAGRFHCFCKVFYNNGMTQWSQTAACGFQPY